LDKKRKEKKMEYTKILEQIKNKKFTVENTEKSNNTYELAEAKIVECLIVNLDHPQVEHWLVDYQQKQNLENPIIAFKIKVKMLDGEVLETVEADNLLTKKGKLKYYKTFEINTDTVPASLLYDITRRCRDYSTEQSAKFETDPFVLDLEVYKNMKFKINAKRTKQGVKLLTELQALKDKEYYDKMNLLSTDNGSNEPIKPITADDLPF